MPVLHSQVKLGPASVNQCFHQKLSNDYAEGKYQADTIVGNALVLMTILGPRIEVLPTSLAEMEARSRSADTNPPTARSRFDARILAGALQGDGAFTGLTRLCGRGPQLDLGAARLPLAATCTRSCSLCGVIISRTRPGKESARQFAKCQHRHWAEKKVQEMRLPARHLAPGTRYTQLAVDHLGSRAGRFVSLQKVGSNRLQL